MIFNKTSWSMLSKHPLMSPSIAHWYGHGPLPQEAELETTAMVNAALTGNICTVDNAQILVHIGEQSTSVVVMDGGKVREMRAIHIGALTHELAMPAPVLESELPVESEDAAPSPLSVLDTPPDPAESQRRTEQAIKRIRRELGRTVSAVRTVHPIESIYVCGFDLPGFLTLTPNAEIAYKVSAPYSHAHDRSLNWADPTVAILWPLPKGNRPQLSDKDDKAPLLPSLTSELKDFV